VRRGRAYVALTEGATSSHLSSATHRWSLSMGTRVTVLFVLAGILFHGSAAVAAVDPYSSLVLSRAPNGYYRLNEPAGSAVAANDVAASGGPGMSGVYHGSPSREQPGLPGTPGDTSASFNGAD